MGVRILILDLDVFGETIQEEWIIYVRLPVELTILAMAFAFVIGRHIDDVVPRLGSLSLGCLYLSLPMDAESENSWLMAGE